MIRSTLLVLLAAGPLAHWPSGRLAAQDITGDVAGWRTDQTRTGWRIGMGTTLHGPVGSRLFVQHQEGLGSAQYSEYGVGGDLTLFERGRPGLYLLAGVSTGFARRAGAAAKLYDAWSAGLGYEWVPLSFLVIRGEGRWRSQWPGPERGLELSVGTALRLRVSRAPRQRSYTDERRMVGPSEGRVVDLARAEGIGSDKAELLAGVVETATNAMGTPYQWGGTGANGGGFDCSGLIQYAYRQHGIQLPRTSSAQAEIGVAVRKALNALTPGDILTFSNSGGHVTHVALYIGDGKIIHSANGGVQMSRLSPTDSYGKWWWNRWVGVRRVVK
ncbi:MAG: C40 family peptidase [Gemmatimonadales bacterium]